MDLLLQRAKGRLALVPATDLDADRLRSIRSYDTPVQAVLTFPRTSRLNRWYRGLLARVADAIDCSPDALHSEIKFKAGLIEQIIMVKAATVGAGVAVRLKSTAFPVMEDLEFSRYVDYAVELLFRDYLPQVRAKQKKALIAEWAGRRPRLDPQPKITRAA